MLSSGGLNLGKSLLVSRRDHQRSSLSPSINPGCTTLGFSELHPRQLVPLLEDCASNAEERLRAAARGGAKLALGNVMGHHPEMDIKRVVRCLPAHDADGNEINPAVVYNSVTGYASFIADKINPKVVYARQDMPELLRSSSEDEISEQTGTQGEEQEEIATSQSEGEAYALSKSPAQE